MIKRIDVFMPPLNQYGVLHHITNEIFEALQRAGVNCRLLVAERENPEPFLESIFSDPPECTLSLNGLLPDNQGRFFCDMIKIPHVACLLDSPNQFILLTQSPLNIITCPDLFSCQFFKGLNFENVLFMPHGVGKDLAPDPNLERKFDVVMLASCIDYENLRDLWKEKHSKGLCEVLDKAAEMALSDQMTPYVEAFVQALAEQDGKADAVDPSGINLMQVLDDLEMYIKGKDRVELVRAIKDVPVDVFGTGREGEGWQKYLGDKHPNVTLHKAIPFEDAIDVMKQSKILLNSCPWMKHGGHERLFAGMACGALLVTNENVYMKEHFTDGEDLVFYRHSHRDEINDLVKDCLSDPSKLQSIAEKGREKVMAAHTWDHRVKGLLEQLSPILEKIKSAV